MNDLKNLYAVLEKIFNQSEITFSPLKLFSFEGLPGAGKSTQIKLVADALSDEFGKVAYIDLPTESIFGKILAELYRDNEKWFALKKSAAWLNPVFLSADLRAAIDDAVAKGARCALMSRGILSTYYYNLDVYADLDENFAWSLLEKYLRAFYLPTAIFFLEVSETEAYERVKKRNREPLREMDHLKNLRADDVKLHKYLSRLKNIPVHYVDATGTPSDVTQKILKELKIYLKES